MHPRDCVSKLTLLKASRTSQQENFFHVSSGFVQFRFIAEASASVTFPRHVPPRWECFASFVCTCSFPKFCENPRVRPGTNSSSELIPFGPVGPADDSEVGSERGSPRIRCNKCKKCFPKTHAKLRYHNQGLPTAHTMHKIG